MISVSARQVFKRASFLASVVKWLTLLRMRGPGFESRSGQLILPLELDNKCVPEETCGRQTGNLDVTLVLSGVLIFVTDTCN